ncbi:MAG: hypothetical protein OEM84_10810 [Acidimicrobiia bacterium]|nr:hypothetical protein [Acidimicrobiia bacterium]
MDRQQPSRPPFVPFSLSVDVLDRMINFEISDNSWYRGLEIQGFDDPLHGSGIVVFFERTADRKIDVYYQPGLKLDRARYGIGGGLGEWVETDFEVARLSVTDTGVDAEVRFVDVADRPIEIRIADRTRRPRRWAAFLAPGGVAIADPQSMPLWWMSRFDLLRRTRMTPVIRIAGEDAAPGRLPAEWLLRRRLIKVASNIFIVELNASGHDPMVTPNLVTGDGAVEMISAVAGDHVASLRFDPPLPHAPEDVPLGGTWELSIGRERVIAGIWSMARRHSEVAIAFDVTQGWRPKGLPLLMEVVIRVVPVFRKWPTTYRWRGSVSVGDTPASTGRWERIGDERGESYRAATKSEMS